MEGLVSVIIPTYKRSSCLLRAINSVLNQTYKKIEIIVVDDNNEDSLYRTENEKKLEKYVNKNKIIYLKHKKNLNGANARNTAIKKATGEYITFLDDDDYFLPDRIEKMVMVLKDNSNYDGAYSSVIFEDSEGNITNLLYAKQKGNLQKSTLCCKSFFGTGSNMFFRKSIVDKIGMFDAEFKRHQDMEYMVRFFQFSKIINVDEFLVVKSNMDSINKPNYYLLLEAKEKFLNKFKLLISSYNLDDKNNIYSSNLFELYNCAPLDEKKKILEKLILYGENKYIIYFKNFKVSIKKLLKKYKLIKKIYMVIINGNKYKILLQDVKKSIENLNV